jgi:hypothetical protein
MVPDKQNLNFSLKKKLAQDVMKKKQAILDVGFKEAEIIRNI